jgi:hypothetical protein
MTSLLSKVFPLLPLSSSIYLIADKFSDLVSLLVQDAEIFRTATLY